MPDQPTHPQDPDCIFCRIIQGDIPCHKLHEDDHTLAFLDINPVAPAHTLLIPKAHHATLDQLPPATAAALFTPIPKLAAAVTKSVGAEAYNILQNNGVAAGQAVHHVHIHIIPRGLPDSNFTFTWPATHLDNDHAANLIQKIRANL
ncbi:MAG: HIT family protein [Phycisphaeraceae bacterium]